MDRAALDTALQLDIGCGGWCPNGRLAEDGRIDEKYPLKETPKQDYEQRTEWNVQDSDATLILTNTLFLTGGTALTYKLARQHNKPLFVVDLTHADIEWARRWLMENRIETLNIAGPRESQQPGIYRASIAFLQRLLKG